MLKKAEITDALSNPFAGLPGHSGHCPRWSSHSQGLGTAALDTSSVSHQGECQPREGRAPAHLNPCSSSTGCGKSWKPPCHCQQTQANGTLSLWKSWTRSSSASLYVTAEPEIPGGPTSPSPPLRQTLLSPSIFGFAAQGLHGSPSPCYSSMSYLGRGRSLGSLC